MIQPYIGMQFGIQALRQRWLNGQQGVAEEIERLATLSQEGIQSLRSYVNELEGQRTMRGGLEQALRRFATRFAEATGISVEVSIDQSIMLNGLLAAEVFQIVSEGLSNIRRHTQAVQANVDLRRSGDTLLINLANPNSGQEAPPPFMPRSISQRADALGGQTCIQVDADASTLVRITIPL
jgi:signal transduction histidine kinase